MRWFESIGVLAGRYAAIIFQVLLTAHVYPLFSVEQFACWSLLSATIATVSLFDFGIEAALVYEKSLERFWGAFHRAGVYFLAGAIFCPWLVVKVVLVRTWLLISRAQFKAHQESHYIGWIEVVGWIITGILILPFREYETIVNLYLLSFLIAPLITVGFLLLRRGWRPTWNRLPRGSFTLWGLQLSLLALWAVQPFIVSWIGDAKAVGDFSILQKLYGVIAVSVNAVMVPYWAGGPNPQLFRKLFWICLAVTSLGGLVLLFLSPLITTLWIGSSIAISYWGIYLWLFTILFSQVQVYLPFARKWA